MLEFIGSTAEVSINRHRPVSNVEEMAFIDVMDVLFMANVKRMPLRAHLGDTYYVVEHLPPLLYTRSDYLDFLQMATLAVSAVLRHRGFACQVLQRTEDFVQHQWLPPSPVVEEMEFVMASQGDT